LGVKGAADCGGRTVSPERNLVGGHGKKKGDTKEEAKTEVKNTRKNKYRKKGLIVAKRD